MLHWLINQLLHSNNQFTQGGLVLMFIGGFAAALRSVPSRMWIHFLNQTTMSLTITNKEDYAFKWFRWWVANQSFSKKIRRTDAYVSWAGGNRTSMLTPAPGVHWVWKNWRPLRISMTRSDENKGYSSDRAETFIIQTYGRDTAFLRKFLKDIEQEFYLKTAGAPKVYIPDEGHWGELENVILRPLSSVVLPGKLKEILVADLKKFQARPDWYAERGIPYRRCYLAHGLPGTGKTSMVAGLANELKLNLCLLSLSSLLADSQLFKLIREVPLNSIVLLEDVDCVSLEQRVAPPEDSDDSPSDQSMKPMKITLAGITMAGLLNVLDGIMTPKGTIFVMTTNHVDKLDPAIVRAGRCDVKIEFKEATDQQKLEMYSKFFPEHSEEERMAFVAACPARTTSDFQEALIQLNASLTEVLSEGANA